MLSVKCSSFSILRPLWHSFSCFSLCYYYGTGEFKLMASMNFMAKMDRTFYYFIQWCENRHATENMNEAYILQCFLLFMLSKLFTGWAICEQQKQKSDSNSHSWEFASFAQFFFRYFSVSLCTEEFSFPYTAVKGGYAFYMIYTFPRQITCYIA